MRPLLYSLVFLAGLEFIALFRDYVFIVVFFLFFISLYSGRKIGKKWTFSILPALFTLSTAALLYLITLIYEEQLFILLASFMYYLSLLSAYRLGEYGKDQTARAMNMAAAASTVFFAYSGAYGIYLNFAIPLYYLMLIYLAVSFLASFQYFSILKTGDKNKKIAWLYSFILALAMAEIVWTINFWPFGYLTAGVIALILYYVLWDIVQSHFLNLLSRKRATANLIFFSIMIILVLLSSKWLPMI